MTLGSPRLERSLRRKIRRRLRENPAQWREYRRRTPRWWRRHFSAGLPWYFFILIIPGLFLLFSRTGDDRTRAVDGILLAIAFTTTVASLSGASRLSEALTTSFERIVLQHLPVSDRDYFGYQWRGFGRSCVAGLLALAGAGAAIAWKESFGLSRGFLAIALMILHWVSAVSLVVWLATASGRRVGSWAALGCVGGTIAGVIWFYSLTALPGGGAGPAILLFPMGWVPFAVRHAVVGGNALAFLAAAPPLVLALSLPWHVRRLKSEVVSGDIPGLPTGLAEPFLEKALSLHLAEERAIDPDPVDSPQLQARKQEELKRSLPEMAEEMIRDRGFLEPLDWNRRGVLERIVARWLTEKERTAAEFLAGSEPDWTQTLKLGSVPALGGTALGLLLPSPSALWFVFPIGLSALITWIIPALGTAGWPGLKPVLSGAMLLPADACFPLGYKKVTRTMIKANIVRCLAAGLILLPCIVAGSWKLGLPPETAAAFSTVGLLMGVAAIPVLAAVQVVNAPLRGWFAIGGAVALIGTAFVIFFASLFLILESTGAERGIGLAIVAAFTFLISWLGWRLLGLYYHRGRVDLMSSPIPGS